jgi:thiamine-phosphate pyrophosphorylase
LKPSSIRRAAFRLYLITDDELADADLIGIAERALAATDGSGEVAVQLRNKRVDAGRLLTIARKMRQVCHRHGAALFVNDRIDVAIASGADGIHLPAAGIPPADARRMAGESILIGVSTHDDGEVGRAAAAGADFVVYGPIFAPLSKATGFAPARGVESLKEVCRNAAIPVYALGGITAERIADLRGSGAAGVAAIGAIFRSPDPGAAVRAILDAARDLTGPTSADKV